MLHPQSDGSLQTTVPLYQKIPYELSNRTLLAQADGSFSVSRYAIAEKYPVFEPDSFYTALSVDGSTVPFDAKKKLSMLGRIQHIHMPLPQLDIACDVFLDDATQAVFQQYTLRNTSKGTLAFGLAFGYLLAAKHNSSSDNMSTPITITAQPEESGILHYGSNGWLYTLACNLPVTLREIEGLGLHYALQLQLTPETTQVIQFVYTLHTEGTPLSAATLLGDFDSAYKQAQQYNVFLQAIMCGSTDTEKALFASALNCAISSYKEVGNFKGFYAGIHYQTPPRTYYRDGYFTILPILPHLPHLVREEILTLSLGIGEDGSCPSAVVDETTVFWPNHLDSPAYFIMMLHDYLAFTQDFSFLQHVSRDKTMLEYVLLLADTLLAIADGNNLLCREAGNRHDWVDNIYREGYVTYIEALYYRAIFCTSRILASIQDERTHYYAREAEKIKYAINTLLWNKEKGWYNNYQSENCVEDNLSIDTVLMLLFDIAEKEHRLPLLQNMERWLESKNNPSQPFGDWGTLCCYPFYKHAAHLVEKSAYPFLYHNGSDWPYWSCTYAFCKNILEQDCTYPLTRWFTYALEQNWATPVEYYNPVSGRGSYLQGWSAMAAFTLHYGTAKQFPFRL